MSYSIYSLKNYQITRDTQGQPITPIFSGSVDQVATELKKKRLSSTIIK